MSSGLCVEVGRNTQFAFDSIVFSLLLEEEFTFQLDGMYYLVY